ncbi:MAG: hypothetical protein U0175_33540, partial [Caldilineaceae bacterium]
VQVNTLLAQMVVNKDRQAQMHSDVRLALQERDLHVERSKRWFGMLMSTARIAFQNQPGVLETMIPGVLRTEAEREATRTLMAERRAAKKKAAAEKAAQPVAAAATVGAGVTVI